MSGIQVIVHRDSVCAGDDALAPNEARFWLSDKAQVSEIFKELSATGYLPSIAGSNEHWEVSVNDVKVCSFSKSIENPDYLVSSNILISELGSFQGTAKVWLKYFSAPN